MADLIPEGQAQVLLEIKNLATAGGTPFHLLRDREGRHCLAQQVGSTFEPRSGWVVAQDALDVALRILGGDRRAITEPRAQVGVAVALLGVECWLEQARRNAARETEGAQK